MATAPQWPRLSGFDDQVDDPLVLVDRFKQHYISICHHTADNPTATAPATYVMDVMFQANKIITLLAKQVASLAAQQCTEAKSVVETARGVVREERPVESESGTTGTFAESEEAVIPIDDGAEGFADNVTGTIHNFEWRDDDSEGDQDYEDDGFSEMDVEDEHYEYGDSGDIKWELASSGDEQHGRGSQGGQQAKFFDGVNEVPMLDAEKPALCTILDTSWDDENSAEDEDYEDDGSSDHDSEDDYYEYGDFDDEEDEEDPIDGERQVGLEGSVNETAELATEHVVLGNINDDVWRDEDSEGDQDWEDTDSSDGDSEDDYYEYGDFEDDDGLEGEPQRANGDEHQSGTTTESQDEIVDGHEHCTCVDTSYWRDVYDSIPGLVIQEIPVRESAMSLPPPTSLWALYLKIRWSCAHPPYQNWSSQGLTHHDIIEQIHAALATSGLPELKGIRIQSIKPYNLSGDLEVHFPTFQDKECLAKSARAWVPLLKQGHLARIRDIYYPDLRLNAENISQTKELSPQPSETCTNLPGLKIRWNFNSTPYKAWDSQGLAYNDIWKQVYAALEQSGHPELPAIHIPYMDVGSRSGDIDLFFNSYTDRDMLYDYEGLWMSLLEQGHLARIVLIHDPKEEPEPRVAKTEQCTQTTPLPTIEVPDEAVLPLTIHWNSDPPYRSWEARGLRYEDIKTQLSHALDKIIEPPLTPESSWSFDIISESGDINIHFKTLADRTRAIDNITTWFPLLGRSEVARIPGVYNPLRRAKSNAKFSRQSRSPQAEPQRKGTDESVLTVQDGVNGAGMDKDASPGSQTRSERQLERRTTKRRQKRWENKLKRNTEIMAC